MSPVDTEVAYSHLRLSRTVYLLLLLTIVVGVGSMILALRVPNLVLLIVNLVVLGLWFWNWGRKWQQPFFLVAVPVVTVLAGRFASDWRFAQADWRGVNWWMLVAAALLTIVIWYLARFFAGDLFRLFPKLEPKVKLANLDAKQIRRHRRDTVQSEAVFLILLIGAVVALARVPYFLLFSLATLLFMRWFTANNWERLLMVVGLLIGGAVALVGAAVDLWNFAFHEVFFMPLWVPVAAGLFTVSLYKLIAAWDEKGLSIKG